MGWDPSFVERCAALFPFVPTARALRTCRDWPTLEQLQDLCDSRGVVNARGMPLRLVGERGEQTYETRLYMRGEMHVRSSDWHDLLNVMAWLSYPRIKAALNARHHEEETRAATAGVSRGGRTPVRDALTIFDESGAIVVARDSRLLELISTFQWKQLFWTERARAGEDLQVLVVGHALAAKLLAPYVGLTAHAVLLCAGGESTPGRQPEPELHEIDHHVAELVRNGPAFESAQTLAPLPVLGVPGWFADNGCEAFYDNVTYFRAGRSARQRR